MKRIFTSVLILSSLLTSSLSLYAKEIKRPDSYAYQRGVEAFNQEELLDARDWFAKEINDNPNNGYAYLYLSLIDISNNDYGYALANIDRAISKIPKKDTSFLSSSYRGRAMIYLQTGDTVQALNDLGTALKIEPQNTNLYKDRAQIYYEREQYPESDNDYRKIIEIDRGNELGYMGLARNAMTQGKYDEAIDGFTYVIKLWPDYAQAYTFRAESNIGKEQWNEATDDILKALKLNPDEETMSLIYYLPEEAQKLMLSKLKIEMSKDRTEVLWPYIIATVSRNNYNTDDAIRYYEIAYGIDPDPYFLKTLAQCYEESGNLLKALEYVDQYINLGYTDYAIVDLKASLLGRMGKLEEALESRNLNVDNYPDYGWVYVDRGNDLMDAGRFGEASEDFNLAFALLPILTEFPYQLMKQGDAYRLSGKPDEAAKYYRKMLEIEDGNDGMLRQWSPFALTGLGEKERAIEMMEEIITQNDSTDNSGELYNLACLYARIGDNEKAIETLRKSIEGGYGANYFHIIKDYDLLPLRELPEFQEMMEEIKVEYNPEDNEDNKTGGEPVTHTVEIPFTRESGVTKVKCSINGLPLYFVFDTGASDVTISLVEANFMLKNDYIKPFDIIGSARYSDANGDVNEGTVINLRNVNFGGLELDNVRASVVRNQKAPLLLGQSVLSRLGKIEIDNKDNKLIVTQTTRH